MKGVGQSTCCWVLLLICVVQTVFIMHMLFHHYAVLHPLPSQAVLAASPTLCEKPTPAGAQSPEQRKERGLVPPYSMDVVPTGVAVTLFLHAPAWFQRRYTMMVQNVISNIPDDWKVQIFYVKDGASIHGLEINPGIQKWVANGKVVLTVIAPEVFRTKRKRFELMVEPWLWENILAERVLTFGGTSVLCSNSKFNVGNFSQWDYIGTPWGFKKGLGGEGSVSLRNRSAMLAAIRFELDKVQDAAKRAVAYKTWGQEDQFFVSRLLDMQRLGVLNVTVASSEATREFGGNHDTFNNDVLAVAGTLPAISYADRQAFFSFCPELKIHYPSLHDPACFGATPNGTLCGSTICALRPKSERKGGC